MEGIITGLSPRLDREALKGPVRVLVKSSTHLVPGDDYLDRNFSMLDRICQLHWQRDYIPKEDRYELYGNRYGYPNRPCYFLLDKGSTQGQSIYEIWYYWDGTSLILQTEPIPSEIRARLDQVDFSRPVGGNRQPRRTDEKSVRKSIRSTLRSDDFLTRAELLYLEKPENRQWLRDNIEDRFFQLYEAQVELHRPSRLWYISSKPKGDDTEGSDQIPCDHTPEEVGSCLQPEHDNIDV